MNKVTSYFKNASRSVAYATADASKKLIPEVSDFVETNSEIFRAIYATASHSKRAVAYGKKLAKESQVYRDINNGINNVISDLKTGNWYNKEREASAIDSTTDYMLGGDEDFDFGDFDDDFGFDDDDDGSLDKFQDKQPKASVSKSDMAIVDGISKNSSLSAQLISKTVANTSKAMMNTNVATTNMMMAQNVELMAGLRTSISGMHESINSLLKFNQDNVINQINNEAAYFTKSQELLEDNNRVLHEILDIQKNMYKPVEKGKSSDQFSQIFSGSSLDLKEYFKVIGKNIKNLDPTGTVDMLTDTGMGSSMLSQILSNPVGMALTGVMAGLMPKSLTKSIMDFNKTLGGFFPSMITKINKFKDRDGFLGIIGKLFGVKMDTKTSIDTSKYNKDAVPFDGITRKAIVDVIPEHLSRIEALLSGSSQRTYDYDTGSWIDTAEIKKRQKEEYERIINDSFADVNDTINAYRRKMIETKALDFDSLKNLDEDIKKMKETTFKEKNGHFAPDDIIKDITSRYSAGFMSDDKVMIGLLNAIKNSPVSNIMGISSRTADNKRRYADKLRDDEVSGTSINRKLYDKSNINSHLKYDNDNRLVGMNTNSGMLYKDKLGNSAIDYLKDITINLEFIRSQGLGGRNRKGKSTDNFDDFKKSYESGHIPSSIKDAQDREKKEIDSWNNRNYDKNVNINYASDISSYDTANEINKNHLSDEMADYGKYRKTNKENKRWDSVPGKNFGEKWKNCRTFKDRYNLLLGSMQQVAKKPSMMLENLINKANQSIYHLLFEADFDPDFDDEDEDGPAKKIKGLFGKALDSMQAAWTMMTTTLTEKVIDPLVEKYHLDEKWNDLKDKMKSSSLGQKLSNIKNGVKSALYDNVVGFKDYTINSVKDVASPIINDPIIAKARMAYNNARIAQLKKNAGNKKEEDIEKPEEEPKVNNTQTSEQSKKANISKTKKSKGNKRGKISKKADGGIYDGPDGTKIVVANENEDIYVANRDFKNIAKNAKKENKVANKIKSLFGNKLDISTKKSGGVSSSIESIESRNAQIEKDMNETGPLSITVIATKQEVHNTWEKFRSMLGVSDDDKEKLEKTKKDIFSKIGAVFGEMKGSGYDTVAKGILGGGIGLLTGIASGPLLGAAIGAGSSIIKNSQTVQKFLFGEETVDENGNVTKKKGLISENIQNTFKKYVPNMGKYGITGAVSSLIMPYGPLAGAAIGAGIGLVKSSETMNNLIFGDEDGLFNKDRKDKIKKAFPAATAGAIGGIFLGPFGILGNAALGAGVGLLTQTEEFKKFIFGEDDGTGERFGGLKDSIDRYFVDPLKNFATDFKDNFFDMIKENMIDPLNEAITPITQEIGYITKKVVFAIPRALARIAEDKIGAPIAAAIKDKLVDPVLGFVTGTIKKTARVAKNVAFMPFKAVRGIGNFAKRRQIKRGDANYMGAEERLQFMNGKEYDLQGQDLALAGMNDEQIEEALAMVQGSVNGLDYFDKKIKSNNRKLGNMISQNFKEGRIFGGNAGKIRKALNEGDITGATELLYDLKSRGKISSDQYERYVDSIRTTAHKTKVLKQQKQNLNQFLNGNGELDQESIISELNNRGIKVNNKNDLKRLLGNLKGENKYRKNYKGDLTAKEMREGMTNDGIAITDLLQKIYDRISGVQESTGYEGLTKDQKNELSSDYYGSMNTMSKNVKKRNKKLENKKAKLNALGIVVYNDEEIEKAISKDIIYKIVFNAANKGVKLDKNHILNLEKYDNKTLNYILKHPRLASLDANTIESYIQKGLFSNATKKNKKSIVNGLNNGLNLDSLDDAKEFLSGNNRKKKDRNKRLEYYNRFKKAGLLDKYGQNYIMTANYLDLDAILKNAKLNNNPDAVASEAEADGTTTLGGKVKSTLSKIKTIFTPKGIINYVRSDRGTYNMGTDKETKETLQKQNQELQTSSSIGDKLGSIKDSLFGFFKHQRDKEEKDSKKEPWYKKLFNFDLSSITGKLKFGGSILGIITAIGAISNLIKGSGKDGQGGIAGTVVTAIKEKVEGPLTTVKEWITNTGKYETKGGLQGFLSDHVFPNMFTGMNVIFKYVVPAMVKAFIVNIPTLIKAGISGIGALLGIGQNKHKNDNKFSKASIKAASDSSSSIAAASSAGGSGWKMDTSYFKTTQAQAKEIATNTLSTASSATNGNTSFDVDDINVVDNGSGTTTSDNTSTTDSTTSTDEGGKGGAANAKAKKKKDKRQAVITNSNGTEVKMYKKNKKGKLVPMTMYDVNNGNLTEYYNEKGVKFIYDADTGNFVGENETENTDSVGKHIGKMLTRSVLTGKPMGAVRLAGSAVAAPLRGAANLVLNHTGWTGKAIKNTGHAVARMSKTAANAGGIAKTAVGKAKNIIGNISSKISEHKAANAVQSGITEGLKARDAAKLADGKLDKIITFIKTGLQNLFNSNTVVKRIKEVIKAKGEKVTNGKVATLIKNMVNKLTSAFSEKVGKKLSKSAIKEFASKVASKVIVVAQVGFFIRDFTKGWDQAESILGIENVTVAQRLIAAIANYVNNELFFEIVDTSVVAGWCIETLMPMLGIDTSELQKQREEADAATQKYNEENGTNLSTEEYLKKDKLTYKIEKAVGTAKEKIGQFGSSVKEKAGNLATGVAKGVKKSVGYIADNISDFGGKVGKKFSVAVELASYAKTAVKDIFRDAWAGKNVKTEGVAVEKDDPLREPKHTIYQLSKLIAPFATFPVKVFKTINNTVKSVVDLITTLGGGVAGTVKDMFVNAWNGDFKAVLKADSKSNTGNGYVDSLSSVINNLVKFPLSPIVLLTSGLGAVVRTISPVIDDIKSVGSGMSKTISTIMKTATEGKNPLNDIFSDSTDVKSDNGFVNFASKIANTVVKFQITPISLLTSAVANLSNTFSGIIKGIKSASTLSSADKKIIEKSKKGKLTVMDSKYWKVNTKLTGITGGLYTFNSLLKKVLNVPNALLAMINPLNWAKNAIDSLADKAGVSDDEFNDTSSSKNNDSKPKKGDDKNGTLTALGSGKTKGFVSQLDPKYKNIRFNRSGDTQIQTLGDSGCGPATAANVINLFSGQGSEMNDASKAALQYKDKNSGVRPEYFENYLGRKGISTQSTMSKNEIVSNIANGKPTILLGADPSNKANTPYGSAASHYVLATGMDKNGNAIIQDPESRRPNSLYPMKDLISQTQFGMGLSKRRRGFGSGKISQFKSSLRSKFSKMGFGRGNIWDQDLAKWSPLTAKQIENYLASKSNGGGAFKGNAKVFIDAANASGLDPRYILAHAALESGWGNSNIARKYNNYFGIGAFNSDPENSRNYSNSSLAAGIIGGAKWIRKNYYDAGQKTLYTMRYNNGVHQYCTADDWVQNIASIMSEMPANSSAKFHEAHDLDGTSTSSSDSSDEDSSSTSGILDQLTNLPRAYFNKNGLYDLLFGSSSSSDSSSSSSDSSDGDDNSSSDTSNIGSGIGKEFHDKYNGKWVDTDGKYGAQCFDLFNRFKMDYIDGKPASGYQKARNLWPAVGGNPSKFKQVAFKNAKYGDWIIWGQGDQTSDYGHVGMYVQDQGNSVLTFGQNQGPGSNLTTGKAACDYPVSKSGILGVLRPQVSGKGSGKDKIRNYLKDISSGSYGNKMVKMPGGTRTQYVSQDAPETYSTLDDPSYRLKLGIDDSKLFGEDDNNTLNMSGLSGKGSLPSLDTGTSSNAINLTANDTSSNSKLINTIIDILSIIADNTSKLSDVVALLSKALNLNLTNDDISSLSSNNAQLKNKIANALKAQGSANGLGNSVMTSSTKSLADAMYSIARA